MTERYDYYAFGGRWRPDGSAAQNRWLFNGKESQKDFGFGFLDFGARMFDFVSGRWITQDPLLEQYFGVSPYAYCAGNPVMRIDKDGKKWVNVNGQLMWDDKGYTQYATDDFKRIAIAARATPTGRKAFDIIANSPGNTRFEVNQEIKLNSNGGLIRGEHVFHEAYITPNDTYCIAESSIVVFENAIKKETSGLIKTEGSIADLIHQLPAEIAEQAAMGSVLVHEAVHGTSENLKQNVENTIDARENQEKRHDVEKEPQKWQEQYLREILNQQ